MDRNLKLNYVEVIQCDHLVVMTDINKSLIVESFLII